jgi:prophage regulatory protein
MPAKTRMPRPLNVPGDRMLRRREVEAKIGYGRSTIYKLVATGDFPKPVRTGPNAVRWRLSQVEAWMNEKPENVSEPVTKAGAPKQ